LRIPGTIIQGHRVASGQNQNPLFLGGTLAMQVPFFQTLGLDLSTYHLATLNTSIAPYDFSICDPDWHFQQVKWHPTEPPEDFSFVKISVATSHSPRQYPALIYYPHPETKPAHHQPASMLEILIEQFVTGLSYGDAVWLEIPEARVKLSQKN
jgi:hypothetical protein